SGTGSVVVPAGTLQFTGTFSNLANNTLTGGTYSVQGTLQLPNASIQTDAANIILNGPASAIVDQNGNSALTTLGAVTSAGSLTVENGRSLTVQGLLVNSGSVTVGPTSTLTESGGYTQS